MKLIAVTIILSPFMLVGFVGRIVIGGIKSGAAMAVDLIDWASK